MSSICNIGLANTPRPAWEVSLSGKSLLFTEIKEIESEDSPTGIAEVYVDPTTGKGTWDIVSRDKTDSVSVPLRGGLVNFEPSDIAACAQVAETKAVETRNIDDMRLGSALRRFALASALQVPSNQKKK